MGNKAHVGGHRAEQPVYALSCRHKNLAGATICWFFVVIWDAGNNDLVSQRVIFASQIMAVLCSFESRLHYSLGKEKDDSLYNPVLS